MQLHADITLDIAEESLLSTTTYHHGHKHFCAYCKREVFPEHSLTNKPFLVVYRCVCDPALDEYVLKHDVMRSIQRLEALKQQIEIPSIKSNTDQLHYECNCA